MPNANLEHEIAKLKKELQEIKQAHQKEFSEELLLRVFSNISKRKNLAKRTCCGRS